MFDVELAALVPASSLDAQGEMPSLPAHAYLGENPVSATLVVPGTADATRARLMALELPQEPAAVRRAQTLYGAWLDFYRGNTDRAQEAAVRLFGETGPGGLRRFADTEADGDPVVLQRLGAAYLICCLARYGMRRYHTDAAVACMKELMEGPSRIAQAASIDLSMYELSVGVMSDIPAWIKTGELGVGRVGEKLVIADGGVHPQNLYAAVLASVQFNNYQGEYLKSLALIDVAEKVYGLRSVVVADAYLALFRALNVDALGYPDEADVHLRRAIDLVREDGLWQIVAEFAAGFGGRLLELVEDVDPAGAAKCREISDGLFDRIMRSHEDEKGKRGFQKLTDQEMAVMRLVAAGRSNKEIAGELHIGAETVKFHKRNASAKLGTRPRASSAEIADALERHRFSAEWIG